jgi:O-antigen/teichoic acid export membrane protein
MNTDSREVNSIRNFIVGTTNQFFFLLLNFIVKTVFIKTLGTQFLGINGLFSNIFVLLSFAEFGIGSVMVYSLYEPIAKKDTKKIISIYQFFKKIYLSMAFIMMFIGLLIIPLLKYIINTEVTMTNLKLYYILFLFRITLSNIFIYKSYLIIADQRKYIVWLNQLIIESLSFLLQIVFLLYTRNYIVYLLIDIIKIILVSIFISRKEKKLYPFINKKDITGKITWHEKKEILKKIEDVFIYKFARALITGTDNIIISIMVGTIWVGYYSNYNLIITGVVSLVSMFYNAITASVGNLIVKEKVIKQYKIFKITELINNWISGFTTTCLFILLQDFITLWIGKEYLFNTRIVMVIVFNYYLICGRNTIKVFRVAAGMFEKVKYFMCVAAVLNIFLSILLGKEFGIFGILLATIVTTLSTYYWYEAKLLMKQKFGLSFIIYFRSQIKGVIYTIISIFLTSICVSWIENVSIGTFIIKILVLLIVPNIFYFFVFKNEKEFDDIIKLVARNSKYIKDAIN